MINEGQEYGTTTGRKRKVNWLNMDKLIEAINTSGTTELIISKIDVLEKLNIYKLIHNSEIISFENCQIMRTYIIKILLDRCDVTLENIKFSNNPYNTDYEQYIYHNSDINNVNEKVKNFDI